MIRAYGFMDIPQAGTAQLTLEEEQGIIRERLGWDKPVSEMHLGELEILGNYLKGLEDGTYQLGQRAALAASEKGYLWRTDSELRTMHPHARIYADVISRYKEISESIGRENTEVYR